jgi:hypothetical protein
VKEIILKNPRKDQKMARGKVALTYSMDFGRGLRGASFNF